MRILKYLHSLLVTISLLALSNSGQADSGLDLRASPSWIRGPDFIRQIDLATPQWVLHTNSSNSNFYSLQRMTVEDKVLSMNRPECAVEYFPGRAEEVVETQMERELAKALFQKNYYISSEEGHLNLVTTLPKCDENRYRIDCQVKVSLIRDSKLIIASAYPIWVSKANKTKSEFGLAFGQAIDRAAIEFVSNILMSCH